MSDHHLRPTQKAILDRSVVVVLVYGADDSGEQSYAYVAVAANKAVDFAKALSHPPCALHQWGSILASGAGTPDEATRAYMEQHFGVQHDMEGGVFYTDRPNNP